MTKTNESGNAWSGLLKFAGVAVAVGTVIFHFMGYIFYRNFLDEFGIDEALFPRPADWLVTQGTILAAGSVASAIFSSITTYWFAFGSALLWSVGFVLLARSEKLRSWLASARRRTATLEERTKSTIAFALAPWAVLVVILTSLYCMVLALAIPMVVARAEGRKAAAIVISQAQLAGCSAKEGPQNPPRYAR